MKWIRRCSSIVRVMDKKVKFVNLSMSKRVLSLILVCCPAVFSGAQQPIYLDSSKSIRQRVDDLLSRMTLEEKIGQMNMPCSYLNALGRTHEAKRGFARKFTEGTLREDLGPGGGFMNQPEGFRAGEAAQEMDEKRLGCETPDAKSRERSGPGPGHGGAPPE